MKRNDSPPCWHTMHFEPKRSELNSILSYGILHDSNNVAFTSRMKSSYKITEALEAENFVVDWTKNKQLLQPLGYIGEMVTGSTEAVLTALWHIREYQKKAENIDQMIVLTTEHTHFSVKKACLILSVICQSIKSRDDGTFIASELIKTMNELLKKESRLGFVIVGTIGLATTGKSDDLHELKKIKSEFSTKTLCHLHIDAAAGGLCSRFLNNELPYFDECNVDSFSIDFHKGGMCPYGTGVLIMKENLYLYPEIDVPYHPGLKDYSLLGSKSSIPALCAKAVIQKVKNNWKNIFQYTMDLKEYFIKRVKYSDIEILSNPSDVPMLTIALDKLDPQIRFSLLQELETDFFCLNDRIYCVRLFFNRQITKKNIDELVEKTGIVE